VTPIFCLLLGIEPMVQLNARMCGQCNLCEYFGEGMEHGRSCSPNPSHCADSAVPHGLEEEMVTILIKMKQEFPV